jgi:hypothetical protein
MFNREEMKKCNTQAGSGAGFNRVGPVAGGDAILPGCPIESTVKRWVCDVKIFQCLMD